MYFGVNLGLKWFGFEITTNALGSITRRCSGNDCPGSLFMDPSELQKLGTLRSKDTAATKTSLKK